MCHFITIGLAAEAEAPRTRRVRSRLPAASHVQSLDLPGAAPGGRGPAEWALLWVVGKVDSLGLPIRRCDSRRLVDEIVPELGSAIEPFLSSVEIRPPGLLLAEYDRHYGLWCQVAAARRGGELVPEDLDQGVLWQRVRAFEWLLGVTP